MRGWIQGDLYRVLVLTLLGGLAAVSVALANRSVYTKEAVDSKFGSVERELDHIQQDVQWLVRNQGGTPHVEAEVDRDTP